MANTELACVPVSVCLLTYNRAVSLRRSIDSLLNQSHDNFELIINDNCSTDSTESLGREYERRDRRVRYFRNSENLGYTGNQNLALERAAFEYVALVHDGDIYDSDLILKWLQVLRRHPSAALAFNALNRLDEYGVVVKTYTHPYQELVPGRALLEEMLCRPDSPIFGIVMVRKSKILETGPFDPSFVWLSDVDMWMRLLRRSDAAYVSEALIGIAPREKGHPVRIGNWDIMLERERIYNKNLVRHLDGSSTVARDLPRKMKRMLARERLIWMLWCIRRGHVGTFLKGVRYCFHNPLIRRE
jgi:glycosyltransferase involved in cell wall biosynthesis